MSQLINLQQTSLENAFSRTSLKDLSNASLESPPKIVAYPILAKLPILNKTNETLYLSQEGTRLIGWVTSPHKTQEEIKVVGFRGVENTELLEKIHSLGTRHIVAVRNLQDVVLLPSLAGGALEDYEVTPRFVEEFNKSISNRKEYLTKALELIDRLRNIGGLEETPVSDMEGARIGFARLAQCQDIRIIEPAMLSLYQLEQNRELTSEQGLMPAIHLLLDALNADDLTLPSLYAQCLILKAYSSLVESLLFRSFKGKSNISRIEESKIKKTLERLDKIEALVWKEQPESLYLMRLAYEGTKRLAQESEEWEKGAKRVMNFCANVKTAWEKDAASTLFNLAAIDKELAQFQDWYELIYAIRNIGLETLQNPKDFSKFLSFINSKELQKANWKLPYTIAEVLGEMILHSKDESLQWHLLEGYDSEEKGVFFPGLKRLAFADTQSDSSTTARVRYKAIDTLRSLEDHPNSLIRKKVTAYVEKLKENAASSLTQKTPSPVRAPSSSSPSPGQTPSGTPSPQKEEDKKDERSKSSSEQSPSSQGDSPSRNVVQETQYKAEEEYLLFKLEEYGKNLDFQRRLEAVRMRLDELYKISHPNADIPTRILQNVFTPEAVKRNSIGEKTGSEAIQKPRPPSYQQQLALLRRENHGSAPHSKKLQFTP